MEDFILNDQQINLIIAVLLRKNKAVRYPNTTIRLNDRERHLYLVQGTDQIGHIKKLFAGKSYQEVYNAVSHIRIYTYKTEQIFKQILMEKKINDLNKKVDDLSDKIAVIIDALSTITLQK